MLKFASNPLLGRKIKGIVLLLLTLAVALGAAFYSGKNYSGAVCIERIAAASKQESGEVLTEEISNLGFLGNPYEKKRMERFIEEYIVPLAKQETTAPEENHAKEPYELCDEELYTERLTTESIMRAALNEVEEETLELMASPVGTTWGGYIKVYAGTTPLLITEEDKEVLLRIVEAEATCEDVKGRMLVANVILNRVVSEKFPDSITEVVFQNNGTVYQFAPIKDGRYWSVTVSEKTREAVERVLAGEDYSKGALYFAARKLANKKNMDWFDSSLTWLFQYGVHEFFTD